MQNGALGLTPTTSHPSHHVNQLGRHLELHQGNPATPHLQNPTRPLPPVNQQGHHLELHRGNLVTPHLQNPMRPLQPVRTTEPVVPNLNKANPNPTNILILADSRGRNLSDELHNILGCRFTVLFYPGAGILDSVTRAKHRIIREHWSQIYCLAGICDLTVKDANTKLVAFKYPSAEAALAQYQLNMIQAYDTIHNLFPTGATPRCIFAPVTGMDLSRYNKRVEHPLDAQNQLLLNEAVSLINTEVTKTNIAHGLSTPWTSRIIHRRNRKSFTNYYHKLAPDGCHLSLLVVNHWADMLHESILNNQ